MELFNLSGKTAVVTGSTKGIGEAIAYRLAEHGANVVVSSRKVDACERVAGEINAKWGKGREVATPIPCNINHREGVAIYTRLSAKMSRFRFQFAAVASRAIAG